MDILLLFINLLIFINIWIFYYYLLESDYYVDNN